MVQNLSANGEQRMQSVGPGGRSLVAFIQKYYSTAKFLVPSFSSNVFLKVYQRCAQELRVKDIDHRKFYNRKSF